LAFIYAAGMIDLNERFGYNEGMTTLRALGDIEEAQDGRLSVLGDPGTSMLEEGMAHMLRKLYVLLYPDDSPYEDYLKKLNLDKDTELNRQIRLQLARMEYALWITSTKLTAKKWIEDTLQPTIDLNSLTFSFIRDVFGTNSITYQKFNGSQESTN
jgi:hypothetical protein